MILDCKVIFLKDWCVDGDRGDGVKCWDKRVNINTSELFALNKIAVKKTEMPLISVIVSKICRKKEMISEAGG